MLSKDIILGKKLIPPTANFDTKTILKLISVNPAKGKGTIPVFISSGPGLVLSSSGY